MAAYPGWPVGYQYPPPGYAPPAAGYYSLVPGAPTAYGMPTPVAPPAVAEVEEYVDPKDIIEMKCDGNYNLNSMIANNIIASEYFKSLHEHKRVSELIDEIWDQVTHLEPMALGKARMPSTAFSILYKLFTLKMSKQQLKGMLEAKDNAMVRGIGFLYLRFVHPPDKLWDWFVSYLDDPQEFQPGGQKETKTIGKYVRELLEDMKYYGTLFPRIPVLLARDLKKKMIMHDMKVAKAKSLEGAYIVGQEYEAVYSDGQYYRVRLEEKLGNGKFLVTWIEYGNQDELDATTLRDPNQFEGDGGQEREKGGDWEGQERDKGHDKGERDKGQERDKEKGQERDKDGRGKEKEQHKTKEKDDRDKERTRDGKDRGKDKRSWSRSKSRDKERDRHGSNHKRSRHSRSPSRGRKEKNQRGSRSRSRNRSKERERKDKREGRSRRSNSGSRSRSRTKDKRKEEKRSDRNRSRSPPGDGEFDIEKEILRREREAASASGKDYARKPVGYKKALSLELTVGTARKRSRSPPPQRSSRRSGASSVRRSLSPLVARKKEMSERQKQQMAKLKEVYGDASKGAPKGDFEI